jgi:hypothetical protein
MSGSPLVEAVFGRSANSFSVSRKLNVLPPFAASASSGGFGEDPKPIVWIGFTPFDATRHPWPQQVWPVRIRAGAFADGVLRQMGTLTNGATIFQDRDSDPDPHLLTQAKERIDPVEIETTGTTSTCHTAARRTRSPASGTGRIRPERQRNSDAGCPHRGPGAGRPSGFARRWRPTRLRCG